MTSPERGALLTPSDIQEPLEPNYLEEAAILLSVAEREPHGTEQLALAFYLRSDLSKKTGSVAVDGTGIAAHIESTWDDLPGVIQESDFILRLLGDLQTAQSVGSSVGQSGRLSKLFGRIQKKHTEAGSNVTEASKSQTINQQERPGLTEDQEKTARRIAERALVQARSNNLPWTVKGNAFRKNRVTAHSFEEYERVAKLIEDGRGPFIRVYRIHERVGIDSKLLRADVLTMHHNSTTGKDNLRGNRNLASPFEAPNVFFYHCSAGIRDRYEVTQVYPSENLL